MKNVMLIGFGPHAKRIYISYLKKLNYNLKIIVDIDSNYFEIENYLKQNDYLETKIWCIPQRYKDCEELPRKLYIELRNLCTKYNITHIICSTEPKAHNMYLNFALDNNINILCDKPILVTKDMQKLENIKKVHDQYYKLLDKYNFNKCKCMIMCQRRCHRGYAYIMELLEETIKKYNIPITYIDVYHCDGNWEMPHDLEKENHPYKYGYGKLYHSGYHFIDVISQLISLNNLTSNDKKIVNGRIYGDMFTPNDEAVVFNSNDYKKIFKNDKINGIYDNLSKNSFIGYGEKNYYGMLNFTNKDNKTITTVSLNLLHYGFSRRGWFKTKNFYKENGRVRHERINIQVGPLMNIQIHSYQSKEIKDRSFKKSELRNGGLEHFDIDIYRNVDLIGGRRFERIKLEQFYKNEQFDSDFMGYNEYSREEFIKSFLEDDVAISDIRTHKLGIEILYSASKTIYDKNNKINQLEKIFIPKD